ncbi:helix-turn-helix domain-containing protein [Chryseobacterium sp. CT-SW4]|uniref:helix-turn-helix domain-containing protein n=1 Tax=Chryseobacterium sp. SW-1 TaxID=3157343 RepID=UPI003B014AC3
MKEEALVRDDHELFLNPEYKGKLIENMSILHWQRKDLIPFRNSDIYLKSTLFILVLNGTGTIEINFKDYQINQGEIILLSFGHFFTIKALSEDFTGCTLYIGKDYINEMYSGDMLYKRIKYGVRMYRNPVVPLPAHDFNLLKKRIEFAEEVIDTEGHHYLKEMILNSLRIFFLDLTNTLEKLYENKTENPSREEIYFRQFLDLLVNHYKTEHKVEFYAQSIPISTHYLTQIVKRLTGQTVSDFIFQLVYSEAQQLLKQPELSIQQVALQLNFSDQSAFGKFFKRKSGVSPKEFRNNMNYK